MISYLYNSVFDSPAQTLTNTVNTEGVMGKGIAKAFRERYPEMYSEYRKICMNRGLQIGNLHLWKGMDHWVLNFPTKTTWRQPSKIEYIEEGLNTFVKNFEALGITSISFPPLGCGNGGLNWQVVRPIMESYLGKISIPVYIHNLHVGAEFVPEHSEIIKIPDSFPQFLSDIMSSILENKSLFFTGSSDQPFRVLQKDDGLVVVRDGRERERISKEELENAWVGLRDGVLSTYRYPDENSRRNKSYLFPILKALPYVRTAPISRTGEEGQARAEGLFILRAPGKSADVSTSENSQAWLSL